jgi:hypothetical protein
VIGRLVSTVTAIWLIMSRALARPSRAVGKLAPMRPASDTPGVGRLAGADCDPASRARADDAGPACGRVFLGLALVLVAVLPPRNVAADGQSMYAVTEGLLHGTLHVSCRVGVPAPGGCVSAFYPLLSFVMVPFALLGHGIAAVSTLSPATAGGLVALLVPALSTAAAGAFCAALAASLGAGRARIVLAAGSCALGTEMLTYSRSLFAEPLAAACLACAVWGLLDSGRRSRWVGLTGCAACVLAKPQLGLALLCLAAALAVRDRHLRAALEVIAALAAGVALYLLYNLARVGDPLDFSRAAGQLASGSVHHHGSAALGFAKQLGVLFVSPNDGVLWYSPVVVIGAFGLWRARHQRTAFVCLAVAAGVVLIYLPAPYGQAWGTRYLVPAMPLLCAGVAILPRRVFGLALAVAALTLVGQLPNVVGNYDRYLYAKPTAAWTLRRVQLVGVWPSAIAQVAYAIDHPPQRPVDGRPDNLGSRGDPPFPFVALWWWILPRAGIPAPLGLAASLLMIAGGLLVLRRTARAGPPLPAALS